MQRLSKWSELRKAAVQPFLDRQQGEDVVSELCRRGQRLELGL